MPSTTSNSVAIDLPSSTVITPSLPTFSIASAMMSPMVWSLFAEIDATCETELLSTGIAMPWMDSTTALVAASMPRLTAIGLAPAATLLTPAP